MTNNELPDNNNNRNFVSKLLQKFKQPKTQIITVLTVASVGFVGYTGVKFLVNNVIPVEVEKQLSKALKREVEVGEITSFSLNHVNINKVSINSTNQDDSYLEIDKIKVDFNLLPVFIKKELPINIKINNVTNFTELDTLIASFSHVETPEKVDSLKLPSLPIHLDITLQIKQANLVVQKDEQSLPLNIKAKANLDFKYDDKTQPLNYQLEANLVEGNVKIEGETLLSTGKSNNIININEISVSEIADAVIKIPLNINQGEVNGDLIVNLPSLKDIEKLDINGDLNVVNFEAKIDNPQKIKALEKPLLAEAFLTFEGQKILISKAKANLGDIGGKAEGNVSLQDGFDLSLNLNPVNIAKVVPTLPINLPVKTEGILTADVTVEGDILEPLIKGKVQSKKTIVDKVLLGDINSDFQADLAEFSLNKVEIQPVAGGKVTANGTIKTDLRKVIENKGKIDIMKMPLNFAFQADLPTTKLVEPYYVLPEEISIGKLIAKGEVKGNLKEPKAIVDFEIPEAKSVAVGKISGSGNLTFIDNKISLNDTEFITNEGKINVTGNGDLKTEKWQTNLIANNIYLTPFLAAFCQSSLSCANAPIDLTKNISLESSNIALNGDLKNISLDTIQGKANLDLNIDKGTLLVDSTIKNGEVQATAKAREITVNNFLPEIPVKAKLISSDIDIESAIEDIIGLTSSTEKIPSSLNITTKSKLAINKGIVDATTNLNSEKTEVLATVNNLDLDEFVNSIPTKIESSQIDLSVETAELLTLAKQPFDLNNIASLNSLDTQADLQLKIGKGRVNATTTLKDNLVNVNGITNNISPQEIIPNLPIDVSNINAQLNLNANLPDLLAFGNNYLVNKTITNIPSLNVNTDANLEVADGRIFLLANVKNNQWEADINTSQINPEILAKQLDLLPNNETFNLPNLDSKIKVAGSVNSLLNFNESIPIQAKSVNINWGENSLDAKGNLTIANLLTKPDISNLQLDVKANSNLASLPINPILQKYNQNQIFLPQEVNLKGIANFKGNIQGNNILSNPINKNNLAIKGDVKLENFALNDTKFESPLTGKVNIKLDEKIAINLQGKEDIIAANIIAKDFKIPKTNLTIPYTPNSIEIRQGGEDGIILEAVRKDNQFIAQVANFPVELFNIAPGIEYGVLGIIKGDVNADLAINLFDLTTTGKVTVKQPGIGNIQATEIATNFSYQNNQAQIEKGVIKFAETEYDLQGGVNLATGEINGKLNLEGDVDDIFKTIKISDLETINGILQTIQKKQYFASANEIESVSIGNNNSSIKSQLNLLNKIDKEIKKLAQKIQQGTIPSELEITGKYEGEINLAGNITNPQIDVDLEGDNWQWLPQKTFTNIVDSLGLIRQENKSIAIPKIAIKGNLKDKQINIEDLLLKIANSEISLKGNLSQEKQAGEFKINGFSMDIVKNFVPIPIDIAGEMSLKGKFDGNYMNPQIQGNLDFTNVALDGQFLEKEIVAEFDYTDYQLNFNTTLPKEIQVSGKIPYHPLVKTENPSLINVNLDTEAISLLGVLSQGQIALLDGDVKADIQLEIDSLDAFINKLSQKNLPINSIIDDVKITGNAILDEATFSSVAMVEPIILNGKVSFLDETKAIQVEQINAKIEETEVNIAGVLPILKPIYNNPNPLAIKIDSQDVDLDVLYKGKIAANIEILGTVLQPEIGGKFVVENGKLSIPNSKGIQRVENIGDWQKWLGKVQQKTAGVFQPKLNDFQVELNSLELAQWGLFRFSFDGNLNLNGYPLDLNSLKADGGINLQRGEIYLGGATGVVGAVSSANTSKTTFYLSRAYENKITFSNTNAIMNPRIDLQVESDISDYSSSLPPLEGNERPDPISRSGQAETIRVMLNIDGNAQQLLPSLAGNPQQFCAVYSDNPISNETEFSQQRLNTVAKCVNINTLKAEGANLGILNSPIVNLSSLPNRSQGELINLIIGGELIKLAEQLQNLTGEQLFEQGIAQFVLVPLAQNAGYVVNDTVSTWGQPLGMKDLRVFPLIEGVYQIQEKNNVSVSYDYIFNEFKVRYQMRF